jgi:GxxExxY protein
VELNDLTSANIGAAIRVHRELGPGLLENVYEECLAIELNLLGLNYRRQVSVPVIYRGHHIDVGYRPDVIVHDQVIVELKAVDTLLPIHSAQLLTYLKLMDMRLGLLINFNKAVLRDGIKRLVNNL